MNKKLLLFGLLMIVWQFVLVTAHGMEEDDTPVMNVPMMIAEHGLSVVFSIVALVLGLRAFGRLGSHKEVVLYFVLAVVVLGIIHILEVLIEVLGVIILSDTTMGYIEHFLTYISLVMMAIGFYKWRN